MAATHLQKINPPHNEYRFYSMQVQMDLFGGVSLIREWGRIGRAGQVRIDHHRNHDAALAALHHLYQKKSLRGYLKTTATRTSNGVGL